MNHPMIIDSFAGGGGASAGIKEATGRDPDYAINHDPEAVAMHTANHPTTRHYTESVWEVDPIVLQIVEGTLNSIEAEIEYAIERTARSPMIREAHDYRVGLFDRHCRRGQTSLVPSSRVAPATGRAPCSPARSGCRSWRPCASGPTRWRWW